MILLLVVFHAVAATPGTPSARGPDGLNAGDWQDLTPRDLPLRWDFTDADLPDGWVRTGWAQSTDGILKIGDSKDDIDIACTPLIRTSGALKIRIHWATEIPTYDPPTWAVVEVRAMAEDGRAISEATRFFSSRSTHMFATETADWVPPENTSLARVCIKTGGAAQGSSFVDWLELAAGS